MTQAVEVVVLCQPILHPHINGWMPGQPCLDRQYLLQSRWLACVRQLQRPFQHERCACSLLRRGHWVAAGAHSSARSHTASKLSQLSARPKKALGQNFCVSDSVLESIVDAAGIQAGDYVLEIGPGALKQQA